MKLGIMSDLHMEVDYLGSEFQINKNDADMYILAGDIYTGTYSRNKFLKSLDKPYFMVMGNHDYYNHDFPWDENLNGIAHDMIVNDIKISGATLWTDMSDFAVWQSFRSFMLDYERISHITQKKMQDLHTYHLDYLVYSEADIIVTHHAPFNGSLGEKYKKKNYELLNKCFVNGLENILRYKFKKQPKLWIHGHTHESFDYMIGETRVICHPRGYPNENNHYQSYQPKIIEV